MGTHAHIVVVGPSPTACVELINLAVTTTRKLEARWSRFNPESEVSRMNRSGGQGCEVSPETFDLVTKSILAHKLTHGRFDPTLLRSLEALGYDRTFAEVGNTQAATRPEDIASVEDIEVDEKLSTVCMNRAVTIDPGGIGKGLAADIVTERIIDAGADGVLVNLGGDIRVRGTSPTGDPTWVITIREPAHDDDPITTVAIRNAAVATSTTLRRTWLNNGVPCHHVVDPRTRCAATGPSLVSTIATSGWWAEASATGLLVDPTPPMDGVPHLAIDNDGIHRSLDFQAFELETSS